MTAVQIFQKMRGSEKKSGSDLKLDITLFILSRSKSSGSTSHIIGEHEIMTTEVTYVYYTEIIIANTRKNINYKLGISVPLTRELHYVESNISYAGTLQFLLSLTVSQTRRNSRQDISSAAGAGLLQ